MSYDYDWCGHVPDATPDQPTPRPCGAPIERWSQEWKHRDRALDLEHTAVTPAPVGPLDEALFLRADRYASLLAASVVADERIKAMTELVRMHEFYRSQAESQLNMVNEDPQFGTVWPQTGPEPDEDANVSALLCLTTGQVFRRNKWSRDWQLAHQDPRNATHHQWPIADAGPFIAWRDGYGFDQVLREAERLNTEFNELHRAWYSEPGYRAEGDGPWGRPRLREAADRINKARMNRTYEANTRAQKAEQQLAALRRHIGLLERDDVQQWADERGVDGHSTRDVWVIDLDKVTALLERPDCGGQA